MTRVRVGVDRKTPVGVFSAVKQTTTMVTFELVVISLATARRIGSGQMRILLDC
jgi:hypothetical protein